MTVMTVMTGTVILFPVVAHLMMKIFASTSSFSALATQYTVERFTVQFLAYL
jgi:hypothetical protein